MAAQKKHKTTKKEESASAPSAAAAKEEAKPVVVSDTVTETTERVEIIETEKTPADALAEFKEKINNEMNKNENQSSGASPQKNFMWPIFFVVFLALVSLIGIFVYKQGMGKGTGINIIKLSPTPTPTLIPEPTKTVNLTKYEIKVLNGSEVGGEAGRQKTSLEAEGFTVDSVGNADNSSYTDTIIQAKKEVEKEFLDKLKSVLSASFTVGEVQSLPDDSSVPVVVIIGTKK